MKKSNVILKIIFDYVLLVLALLFTIFFVPKLIIFFMPIIIGYIISLFANPIVRFLEEKIKMVRKHGSALVICLVIGIIAVALYGLIYLIINQIINIIQELPDILYKLERRISLITRRYDGIYRSMPRWLRNNIDSLISNISLSSYKGEFSSFKVAKSTVSGLTSALIYVIFTVMAAYYFTSERDKVICRFRLCMPGYIMCEIRKVINNFKSILGDYIKVQLKIMLMLIVVLYLGLSLFGIRYSLLLAIVIGFLDLMPLLGIGTVLIPWCIGALLLDEMLLALELLILYVICVVIREVAEPKMFGKRIGIGTFATFFLLYIGLRVAGLIGLVLAMPLGIIIINLYKAGAFSKIFANTKYLYNEICIFRKEVDDYINTKIK